MKITLTVPAEGWKHHARDFDPGAMLVSWVESMLTIGAINVTVEVSLAAFKQGYRVLAYQIVQSNAPIWLASGTIPEGKNIVVEELPTGSYEINDPHNLLCGQELTGEQLHAICEAHRPQVYAVQNDQGAYFTLSGNAASFEAGVSIRTLRYDSWAKAQDVVRGLANQWHPVTATVMPIPALYPHEERELEALKAKWNKPQPKRRTTRTGKRSTR